MARVLNKHDKLKQSLTEIDDLHTVYYEDDYNHDDVWKLVFGFYFVQSMKVNTAIPTTSLVTQ